MLEYDESGSLGALEPPLELCVETGVGPRTCADAGVPTGCGKAPVKPESYY